MKKTSQEQRRKKRKRRLNMKAQSNSQSFIARHLKMLKNKAKIIAKIRFHINRFIAMLPYHILVMGSVAIFAFIFNRWIEAALFLIAFFALRYKFPTTFHAKSIVYCMVLTNAIFCLSIVLCPVAETYIFGALVFAYIDTFILWYIQSKENLRQDKECAETFAKELEKRLKAFENPHNEFLLKCREAKLSQRDTEIAIKYYVEHNTPKEIWLWLCEQDEYEHIEWDSVHQLLWRIGKKVNKTIHE